MSAADISINCVTFNPGTELREFAASLAGATTQTWQLNLIDNGTETELVDAVAAEFSARVVRPGKNLGYGAAANLGAGQDILAGAGCKYVVVANPDMVFRPGCLDRLVLAAQTLPAVGVVGPAIVDEEGRAYPTGRAFPGLCTGFGHAVLGRVWPGNPWTRAYHAGGDATFADGGALTLRAKSVGWVSGAGILVPADVWSRLGGFDPSYFMFFEDVDLCWRAGHLGLSTYLVGSAQALHYQGKSWKARPVAMIKAHHRSAYQFLARRYYRWWQGPLRLGLRVGLALRCQLMVFRSR